MSEHSDIKDRVSFQNLDNDTAKSLLREAAIGRQNQSGGTLMPDQEAKFRNGSNDKAIGFEDAVFAMTNVDTLWPALGKQT